MLSRIRAQLLLPGTKVSLLAFVLALYILLVPFMLRDGLGALIRRPGLPPVQPSDIAFIVGLALAIWTWRTQLGRLLSRLRQNALLPAAVAYLALMLIPVLTAADRGLAIAEWAISVYLLVVLLLAVAVLGSSRQAWWLGVYALLGASVLAIIFGILGVILVFAGLDNPWAYSAKSGIGIALPVSWFPAEIPRVLSTLRPTGNMLAFLLVCTLGPALFLWWHGPSRALRRFGLAVSIASAVLFLFTFSFAITGFFAAAYLAIRWCGPTTWPWRTLRICTGVLAVIMFLGVALVTLIYVDAVSVKTAYDPTAVIPTVTTSRGTHHESWWYLFRPRRGMEVADVSVRYAVNHYAWLKWAALKIAAQHPFTGTGPGSFQEQAQMLARQGVLPAAFKDARFASAQNQVLNTLAEEGLVGLLALIGLGVVLGLALLRTGQASNDPIARFRLAVAASLAGALVASLHAEVLHFRFFWLVLSLGMANGILLTGEVIGKR